MKKSIFLLLMLLILTIPNVTKAQEVDPGWVGSNLLCQGFIGSRCCCTNKCCWEISEEEVEPLPDDKWRIKSTGQVVTGHNSKDGRFWRCACDWDEETKSWVRHQGANTRCLYVPFRGT